jgi:undecaprenyl-diphosphatase
VLFALITWQVTAGGPLRTADEHLGRAVAGHGPQPLMELLTQLGSMAVALPVLAAAIGYTAWRGHRKEAVLAAVTMVLVPVLVVPLKSWTDRQGPLTDATGYYPSGHTATAMVAYGASALILAPFAGRRRTVPVAVALTVATGTGLVLHTYHWPLDVLASVALCGMLLLLLDVTLRRTSRTGSPVLSRSTRRSSSRTPPG